MPSATSIEQLQYPTGHWDARDSYTADERHTLVEQLRSLPGQYRQETHLLSDEELSLAYRPGSWTVRQLVHHVADTHHWHFFRVKQTLAEAEKTTGLFANVSAWVATPDAQAAPVEPSLLIIEGIHQRWAYLCDTLSEEDWERVYYHPGRQRDLTLAQALAIAVWHGRHHLAHIGLALQSNPNHEAPLGQLVG